MAQHKHYQQLVKQLRSNGHRLTKNRLALLEYLCQQERPVSIKQLEGALPKMNIVTIYRAIEQLQQDGIVERLTHNPKEQYFELASPYHQHHHHSVCSSCGKVADIECHLTLPTLKNFIPNLHVVTVYGWCTSCFRSLANNLPKG